MPEAGQSLEHFSLNGYSVYIILLRAITVSTSKKAERDVFQFQSFEGHQFLFVVISIGFIKVGKMNWLPYTS